MEKYKFDDRNGLWYELQGDYYLPCLKLPEEEQVHIGIWGQRHLRYLKKHHRVRYANLQTSGKLNSYLADIDQQAEEIFERLVKQMAKREGVTEQLKAADSMEWVRKIDRQAEALFLRIVKQMADAEGITETLKASDQMKWVGRMNSTETVHPHDLLIQSVQSIYIHTVSSANQVFPISFIADDTTVSLEHKCHIDRSDLKHYNACKTQILAYDTEAYHEPGFNTRPCHQVHAAVCHPHDFRGSIAAVL